MISIALKVNECFYSISPSEKFWAKHICEPTTPRTIYSTRNPLILLWPLGLSKTTPEPVEVCKLMIAKGTSLPNLDHVASTQRTTLNLTSIFYHKQCPNLIFLFLRLGLSNINTTFIFISTSIYVYLNDKLKLISKRGVYITFLMLW